MKRISELVLEEAAKNTLADLTNVFEGIASMRIAQIKDQVLQSTNFYRQLWSIYDQIRVGNEFSFGRGQTDTNIIDKELFIIITAEGGLSGDIDLKLVRLMLKDYDPAKNDIVVIGHHGALQLNQAKIPYVKYYKLPVRDSYINVMPVTEQIKHYRASTVYYQEYISLMVQEVNKIAIGNAVAEKGAVSTNERDVISEATYIFEPSTYDVVAHLEHSMMQIIISQLILSSKLAQYASRFKAMSAAHDRADESKKAVHLEYNRARRAIKDERLKEIVNGLKNIRAGSAA
jgi:F-type H+-transporting ATPase subunit gamma